MKQRAASSLSLSLSLILLLGPIAALASAREPKAPSIGARIERLPTPNKRLSGTRAAQEVPAATGQTQTLLPDGRWLITGGMGPDGPLATMEINDPRTRQKSSLKDSLRTARAWHSATMLPDGNVFIFGGVNAKGTIIEQAEIFNPKSEEIQTVSSVLTPRSHHTATVLTDGRLLVAGGESSRGAVAGKIEFWNFRTGTAGDSSAGMLVPRRGHTATLLPNGSVLLWGGVNSEGVTLTEGEVYDPEAQSFSLRAFAAGQENPSAPYVEASLPNDGAKDVPLEAQLAIRFSKPLRAETVNAERLTLTGPQGNVDIRVVPAEKGMLAFVTPAEKLLRGSAYALLLRGSLDNEHQQLGSTAITFTTVADTSESTTERNSVPDVESWVPDANNLRGNWRSNRPRTNWEDLPPLNGEPGVTALAGQALTLNGQPLANVNIQIDGNSVSTDQTGRFLLSSIIAGHRVMRIDGRPASRPRRVYGTFKVGVEIKAGETNVLPFTLWMPKLDMAHAVTIASPTTREVVITNPQIPGLELHLPPGTVIRDMDGQTVRQVSLTPVPTDRPPFPLPPGVHVPVFFTAQPGGAQVIPPRARVIYPNFTKDPPGARITFWNYDPTDRGWYIYGQGTVTPNGKQVVPDPGVVVYEFTGIMIGSTGGPPKKGRKPGGHSGAGDPVDAATGLFLYEKTDLALPDTMPIVLKRSYRQGDNVSRAFGIGTSHDFEMFLWTQTFGTYQELDLVLADGGRVHYVRTSGCQAGNNPCTSFVDAVYESTNTPTAFYKSRITFAGAGWELKLNDGTVFSFGDVAPLQSIRDRYGNKITISRDNVNSLGSPNGNITKLSSTNGRWIQFTYDSANRVTTARDNAGRTVSYTYDASGRLWKVTNPDGGITTHTYDSANQMLTIKDARGIVYLTNEYDGNGRVIKQTQADGGTYLFAYTVDAGTDNVTQADITNPRGYVQRMIFNAAGYKLSETFALGQPEQQTLTYALQPNTNLRLSLTDSLGRQSTYAYDAVGNVTDVVRLAGTPQAVLTHYTYQPTFSRVTSITDPLNHTYNYGYNGNGDLVSITDPTNNQSTLAYNAAGQLTSATDPLTHQTQLIYNAGDLVMVKDPLNRSFTRTTDTGGRMVALSDALGLTSRVEYDALNQATRVIDPRGGSTEPSYDRNGNVTTITDARGGVTSYTFDNMDNVITRTDGLQHTSSYEYNLNSNLSRMLDRKGQATTYVYDPLDRLKQVTYADASTITCTWDAGSRLTQVIDSLAGTTAYTYDGLDRLTQETTPQGTVNYTYDAAGRRTSMTVLGQPAITYAYDNANRLTGVTQGTATVTIGYDAAGRRTSLTLPNGVVTEYTYNDASELTAMTYKMGATVLGDLTYAYDAMGRVTAAGGSYARTALPSALGSATYNAANRQVTRGSQTLSYDGNGDLINDGTNTYTWNARRQLVAISGAVTAQFQYDAFGRRVGKTVNATATSYLYDGDNVVQELTGASPLANLLTGGLDEVFTRSDASGSSHLVADGLGSTLGLGDSNGVLQTQYTYDPFGSTTASGSASGSASQFTGRENDGTGLYFYRARYYSPTLQRFISEDPMGFNAGDPNLYAYVANDPVNNTDPSGRSLIGRVVRRLAKPLWEGRKITMREAQQIRRAEKNVVVDSERLARQVESGAFKNDRTAGEMLRHDPHEPGYNPHFQTEGKRGHTFYKGAAMFLAPNSMTLSERKDTTAMQMVSAGLWDIATAIDPIGLTDAIELAVGLND